MSECFICSRTSAQVTLRVRWFVVFARWVHAPICRPCLTTPQRDPANGEPGEPWVSSATYPSHAQAQEVVDHLRSVGADAVVVCGVKWPAYRVVVYKR